jgi:thioredoxin reductase (NADPH)
MGELAIVVVDAGDASLRALAGELKARYGAHYEVVACASPGEALRRLGELRAEGPRVPLVLAGESVQGETGPAFLAQVRDCYPTARRGLLIAAWPPPSAASPPGSTAALGPVDFYLPRPEWSPDERFHRAVTESLEEWWRQLSGRFAPITVIGADRSARTHQIRDLLARNSVPFSYCRSDSEEGRAALERLGVGQARGPVVELHPGRVLVDPSGIELAEAWGANVRPAGQQYDVVIVGGGPAGLAAAVYGSSEGLSTGLLEREAFGGQAGTTSLIRNYLGFPGGVSGAELAVRAYEQAWLFGTHLIYGNPATSLTGQGDMRIIGLEDGSKVSARAVIIATGVSYRRLGIPALESLIGVGVFYGASTVEATAVAGKQVFVVGGGNSAGQAALHLSKLAGHVAILIRSQSLAASMSDYLIREIQAAPNIDVRYDTEIAGGGGPGHLEYLQLRDKRSGQTPQVPAGALFVLIGAQPMTQWLPEQVGRDQWGYILTGPDTGARWTLPRAPFLLETSLPGVFAAGDVRRGTVKRVASAVGEGSVSIRLVHQYLNPDR